MLPADTAADNRVHNTVIILTSFVLMTIFIITIILLFVLSFSLLDDFNKLVM